MTTDSKSSKYEWRHYALFGVVYIAVAVLRMKSNLVEDHLGFFPSRPGDEPPFYFIHKDVIDGIYALLGMILTGGVALAARFRGIPDWSVLALLAVIFFLGDVLIASDALLRCSSLMDADLAMCPWPTFDNYLAHTSLMKASGLVPAIVYLVWLARKRRVSRGRQAS